MSTAELVPTPEYRSVVSPGSNGGRVNGGRVNGDPTAVREILFNLLSNAAKYSPQGSYIDVTVEQGQGEARVSVRDRGHGLTTADAERVFGKYQQAGPDASGVGLGLYVSRGLARAHGGDLTVHSATARGSEFRLTLPNVAAA